MTVRDNEVAAASIGVDVWRNRFIAFVIAAAGMRPGRGGELHGDALRRRRRFAFDPNWVVAMMFIVLIGGIGTLKGRSSAYHLLRPARARHGRVRPLGRLVSGRARTVAIAAILFEPAGLWPLVRDRLGGDWLSVRREPPATQPIGGRSGDSAAG